ncbi:phototropic-responsive NPH3 family protein [Tanacetum coccineum]
MAGSCDRKKVNFTPENVIPISCLASYSALLNPLLLGKPIKNPILDEDSDSDDDDNDDEEEEDSEDEEDDNSEEDDVVEDLSLSTLHLKHYEPIILKMVQSKIASHDIASNLYQYAKRWVFLEPKEYDENTSSEGVCSNSRKAIIEAIEILLPRDQSILPCASLSKMLQNARILKANVICRDRFEGRIGRQLDLATVGDLLIATQGGSKEEKYDTECVRRILKHFHMSLTGKDQSRLDIMLIATSEETEGSSDGIYRAIDIYLHKHRNLTKSEREEICAVLNCNKMSPKAREEAARNVRLPVRTMLQVLFAEQLKLREMITKEVVSQTSKARKQKSKSTGDDAVNEEEVKIQLEKSNVRVMELEKECLMLRKEIENGYSGTTTGFSRMKKGTKKQLLS